MKYALHAHLVRDSNIIYWNKNSIRNAKKKQVEEVTVYLSEEEIAGIYAIMSKRLFEEDAAFDDTDDHDDYHYLDYDRAYPSVDDYKELQQPWFDVDQIED